MLLVFIETRLAGSLQDVAFGEVDALQRRWVLMIEHVRAYVVCACTQAIQQRA
jgi:hypothetical protein